MAADALPPIAPTQCSWSAYYDYQLALLDYTYAAYETVPGKQADVSEAFSALDAAQTEADDISQQIDDLTDQEADLKAALDPARVAYQKKVSQIKTWTSKCSQAVTSKEFAAVQKATHDLHQQLSAVEALRAELDLLQAEQLMLLSEKDDLLNASADDLILERDAWCVDLTEDAMGEVATIEVPEEPQHVLIVPGGTAPAAEDGFLLARSMMSPAQAFWSAAVLPGWQRWLPRFRIGTITALDKDADTASVQLDAAVSSAPHKEVKEWGDPGDASGFDVNLDAGHTPAGISPWVLTGIPVDYMTCDAEAFEVGDRVVVSCTRPAANPRQDPSAIQWTVIGFVDHPRECIDTPEQMYLLIEGEDLGGTAYGTGEYLVFDQTWFITLASGDPIKLTLFTPDGSFENTYDPATGTGHIQGDGVTYAAAFVAVFSHPLNTAFVRAEVHGLDLPSESPAYTYSETYVTFDHVGPGGVLGLPDEWTAPPTFALGPFIYRPVAIQLRERDDGAGSWYHLRYDRGS